jgi:hypothetical protein
MSARATPLARPVAAVRTKLCVVLRCRDLLIAIAAEDTARLLLPEQLDLAPGGTTPRVAAVGTELFAAWNLGELLHREPESSAWVLLHVPHGPRMVPIALGTGPCIVVRTLRFDASLPEAVFQARPGAIAAAFTTSFGNDQRASGVGLLLSTRRLFHPGELDASLAAVEGSSRRRAVP